MWNTTKTTLELRQIVDNGENSINIWDFDYPSFYEGEEKTAFERKVIDHYYFRQIGQETVGRWLHYFRSKIREIMPYYIQLYKSVKIMDEIKDPFGNVDVTETTTETRTNTTANTGTVSNSGNDSSSENNSTVVNGSVIIEKSDTPQGSISNLSDHISEGEIDTTQSETIANGTGSNSFENTSTQDTQTTETGDITITYKKIGNQGVSTYAHDMIEYRQSFINVDMMIIEELNDLFLGVY